MNLNSIMQRFTEMFPGDFSGNNMQRQTPKILFAAVKPAGFPHPELLDFNENLAEEIGLGKLADNDLDFLVGNNLPEKWVTYATAYAGHQFGNWAGQLGDGRAIYAGEIQNKEGKTTEIQWKGAGATPYSRHADGRAVLRSSVREYLMSEAMFFLNIPTTRSLSLCLTGEKVMRDMMYDGNPAPEKGAVMIRTAESFLRFGHFELISAQKETDLLKKLTDFAIINYFPEIDAESENKYREFFENIALRTADLMVEWYRVGFVHGVMNTDNMSVLGLTIDYGPFSFLDEYDLNFTPNTTDLPGRRYAFGKQAQIAQWNLWQLANALFSLIKDEAFLEKVLNDFSLTFWKKHDEMLATKFGFEMVSESDSEFFTNWQKLMEDLKIDYTLFFNQLEKLEENSGLKILFENTFYAEITEVQMKELTDFIELYRKRKAKNTISTEASLAMMKANNPKFILRNYILFECIEELEAGKKDMFGKILNALHNPYEEIYPEFSKKRPSVYDDRSGCSMLSCSS
ncbi:MAG: YdiU family protein [Kaistella sp.]|nr:YdiU family protein [Kaistella sp.]